MATTRQRKRKVCSKCGQNLSHAAYVRHQNPLICPGNNESKRRLCNERLQEAASDRAMQPSMSRDEPVVSTDHDSGAESVESESESIEIVSDLDENEDFGDACDQSQVKIDSLEASAAIEQNKSLQQFQVIATHISLFITFFQLCYRVSERGITLLLNFIRAILLWAGNYLGKSTELLLLRDMIPKNVYFLKKLCNLETVSCTYVVCPKCHTLYNLEDCITKQRNGTVESAKCTFVNYSNHHHPSRREKCNASLMKKAKHGSSYRLIPRKLYMYNSLKASLTKLFGKSGFAYECDLWRNRKKSPGIYTDIYDGLVWEKFQSVGGTPFLQIPNNLGFILNIDWFNSFTHIEYSVGVLYLVIANLPRSERYKIENAIIVGVLPGPKEPKRHMNSYLKPLVDELLELWKGTYLSAPGVFVPVRCALLCVSCDLPATRKVCGFTSFSSLQGCSKCMKKFTCEVFGTKSDYSGYEKETWEMRTHTIFICNKCP